jgi:methionyl aminopeptidase
MGIKVKSLIKSAEEIRKMTRAGEILAIGRRAVKEAMAPGVTGKQIDAIFRGAVEKAGGTPIFLGYRPDGADKPYPASICFSVNDVIVHGTPNDKPIKAGDVVSVDMGAGFEGYCADSAFTVGVGKISPVAQKLIEATRESLELAIKAAKPGASLGDIGYVIQSHIKKAGFKIAQGLTGHGIGSHLHEEPYVFNEGKPGTGLKLEPGMCLAIEPMVAIGTGKIVQLEDESYAIADGSLSAHFEHTIVITEKGARVLTL